MIILYTITILSVPKKKVMIMKILSPVWAEAVEKSVPSGVDVGRNRAGGKKVVTFSWIYFGW